MQSSTLATLSVTALDRLPQVRLPACLFLRTLDMAVGLLDQHWQYLFWIGVPLGVFGFAGMLFAARGLGRPQLNRRQQLARIDWLCALASVIRCS